ncbi:hypothetical protein TUM20985_37480 [Mycobacterium antarcticum]|nr:hypothetical protein TUM20985_37480 [Mycolicibacterium sp. TUM20985]
MEMPEINRRKFLIASAGVGALGLSGAAAFTLPHLMDAAQDRPLAANTGILVIVTLYGGNDGVSTVIPYTDGAYYDARADLAYQPSEVIDLDGSVGLNPALTGLASSWRDRSLAIVRGVGYPNQDRSHFRSMDIWQTASPAEPASTGWIGRWLDATGDDPLRAVNLGVVVPPLAMGEKSVAATLSDAIPLVSPDFGRVLTALRDDDPNDTAAMRGVRASYRANARTTAAFRPLASSTQPAAVQPGDVNVLKMQLDLVAKCVKAGVPTQVYMVSLGGFDTHADERGTQQQLLQKVDDALTPFLQAMRTNVHGKDLVVMMYSEFGRRVAANASEGTDHGTSGPVFVMGRPVKGGFYGDEPSLTDLTGGDLKTTTDFRDVYAELLTRTVGTDPGPSVGESRRSIGFL